MDAGNASYGGHLEDTYDRHHFNAIVTKADLVDYYLPAWEACATEAKAGSIMCSCESRIQRSVTTFLFGNVADGLRTQTMR